MRFIIISSIVLVISFFSQNAVFAQNTVQGDSTQTTKTYGAVFWGLWTWGEKPISTSETQEVVIKKTKTTKEKNENDKSVLGGIIQWNFDNNEDKDTKKEEN